jgi:hypothetical protein
MFQEIQHLNNATTINSSLNVVGDIIGSGSALTSLDYNSITNAPDLTVYNAWTKIVGTNSICNTGNSGKVESIQLHYKEHEKYPDIIIHIK